MQQTEDSPNRLPKFETPRHQQSTKNEDRHDTEDEDLLENLSFERNPYGFNLAKGQESSQPAKFETNKKQKGHYQKNSDYREGSSKKEPMGKTDSGAVTANSIVTEGASYKIHIEEHDQLFPSSAPRRNNVGKTALSRKQNTPDVEYGSVFNSNIMPVTLQNQRSSIVSNCRSSNASQQRDKSKRHYHAYRQEQLNKQSSAVIEFLSDSNIEAILGSQIKAIPDQFQINIDAILQDHDDCDSKFYSYLMATSQESQSMLKQIPDEQLPSENNQAGEYEILNIVKSFVQFSLAKDNTNAICEFENTSSMEESSQQINSSKSQQMPFQCVEEDVEQVVEKNEVRKQYNELDLKLRLEDLESKSEIQVSDETQDNQEPEIRMPPFMSPMNLVELGDSVIREASSNLKEVYDVLKVSPSASARSKGSTKAEPQSHVNQPNNMFGTPIRNSSTDRKVQNEAKQKDSRKSWVSSPKVLDQPKSSSPVSILRQEENQSVVANHKANKSESKSRRDMLLKNYKQCAKFKYEKSSEQVFFDLQQYLLNLDHTKNDDLFHSYSPENDYEDRIQVARETLSDNMISEYQQVAQLSNIPELESQYFRSSYNSQMNKAKEQEKQQMMLQQQNLSHIISNNGNVHEKYDYEEEENLLENLDFKSEKSHNYIPKPIEDDAEAMEKIKKQIEAFQDQIERIILEQSNVDKDLQLSEVDADYWKQSVESIKVRFNLASKQNFNTKQTSPQAKQEDFSTKILSQDSKTHDQTEEVKLRNQLESNQKAPIKTCYVDLNYLKEMHLKQPNTSKTAIVPPIQLQQILQSQTHESPRQQQPSFRSRNTVDRLSNSSIKPVTSKVLNKRLTISPEIKARSRQSFPQKSSTLGREKSPIKSQTIKSFQQREDIEVILTQREGKSPIKARIVMKIDL